VSMGLVGSAGSPRTLRVLHCTEVSQSMSQMGHQRRFGHAPTTSALAPIATVSLQRGNRRFGPKAAAIFSESPDQSARSRGSGFAKLTLPVRLRRRVATE